MDKDEKQEHKFVHTYAEDMAGVIKSDQGGLIKKIIHGEEEHDQERKNMSPALRKNKIFLSTSIILLLLSAGILISFLFRDELKTVFIEPQFTPLIFNDKNTFLEVAGFDKEKIAQIVANQVSATEEKDGEVEGIYLTENKQ